MDLLRALWPKDETVSDLSVFLLPLNEFHRSERGPPQSVRSLAG